MYTYSRPNLTHNHIDSRKPPTPDEAGRVPGGFHSLRKPPLRKTSKKEAFESFLDLF